MENIIAPVMFVIIAAVAVVIWKRWNDRRGVAGSARTPTNPRDRVTIEDQKQRWDDAWRNAVAAGMDPESASAKGFVRSAQLSLGWKWEPPTE